MRIDKGQRSQMEAFIQAVKGAGPMPVSLETLFDTTLATLSIEEAARTGREIRLDSVALVEDPPESEPAELSGSVPATRDAAA
jgi:hypothetical protein